MWACHIYATNDSSWTHLQRAAVRLVQVGLSEKIVLDCGHLWHPHEYADADEGFNLKAIDLYDQAIDACWAYLFVGILHQEPNYPEVENLGEHSASSPDVNPSKVSMPMDQWTGSEQGKVSAF